MFRNLLLLLLLLILLVVVFSILVNVSSFSALLFGDEAFSVCIDGIIRAFNTFRFVVIAGLSVSAGFEEEVDGDDAEDEFVLFRLLSGDLIRIGDIVAKLRCKLLARIILLLVDIV